MQEKTVPPVDADLHPKDGADEQERLEASLLNLEDENQKLKKREASQRYLIKWIAVFVGVSTIIGMALLLAHLSHKAFFGPFLFVNSAFTVAMLVAPIASITTITVALFIGAFRRFNDDDLEKAGTGVSSAYNILACPHRVVRFQS